MNRLFEYEDMPNSAHSMLQNQNAQHETTATSDFAAFETDAAYFEAVRARRRALGDTIGPIVTVEAVELPFHSADHIAAQNTGLNVSTVEAINIPPPVTYENRIERTKEYLKVLFGRIVLATAVYGSRIDVKKDKPKYTRPIKPDWHVPPRLSTKSREQRNEGAL